MSFPRYPAYKDSGVDWLGDVPVHWAVARMKHAVESVKNGIWGDDARGDEHDIACVRVADFDRVGLCVSLEEPTIRNVLPGERAGRVLQRGDLLLEKSGGGEQQPVGCVVLYQDDRPAVCSNFVARVTVRQEADASFWRYTHAAAYSLRLNTKSVKQTSGIQNLDSQAYFDEPGPFPPLPEQRAIAAFLDRETAKIDALVAEQRRLMDLLREQRQAVISHAVTKGLNPDAPMKDSGVEWLGEVPAYWRMQRVKHVVATGDGIQMGPFGGMLLDLEGEDTGFKVLGQENTISGDLTRGGRWVCQNRFSELVAYQVTEGDILITRKGSLGNAHLVRHLPQPSIIDSDTIRLRVNHDAMLPEFLVLLLHSAFYIAEQILQTRRGAILPGLNTQSIANLLLTTPPVEEQRALLDALGVALNEIDASVNVCQRAEELLVERRAALITAAVTGQIDVRGLALSETA